MKQYFDNNENLKSQLRKRIIKIFDQQFEFFTDNGVFAKNGLDFGSRLLLMNLDKEKLGTKVLDVGCGYGPIGILLNKEYHVAVDMVDVNDRALHLTKMNANLNKCTNINIYKSNWYQNVNDIFDAIITNPPIHAGKKIVYEILLDAKKHLTKKGYLFFVIHKDQGAKSTINDLKKYYDVTILERSKGFFVVEAKNSWLVVRFVIII